MHKRKRRRRRKGGVKGHCVMCAMQTRAGGLRNRRIPTMQERRAELTEREQRDQ